MVVFASMVLQTAGSAPVASNRQEACYRVFSDLVAAYGRMQPSEPELKIEYNSNDPASTSDNGQILISSRTIEYCFGLGADSLNALAFILSHELAHHYNHHLWASNYGTSFADLDWGKHIDSLGTSEAFRGYYEAQADEFGLFYSYLAGYEVFGLAEEVYNGIYGHFGLPDQLPGYPAREERIKAAKLAEERVQELIPVFETGKFVSILANGEEGNYRTYLLEKAKECYEYIIDQKFVSREMYHNLGVTYLLLALGLEEEKNNPYVYPVVLDEHSRLYDEGGVVSSGDKGMGWATKEEQKVHYLSKSEYYFRQALLLDPNYAVAYLNLANVFELRQMEEDVTYLSNKVLRLCEEENSTELLAYVYDIKGIGAARAGRLNDAKDHFNTALSYGSKLAEGNKQVLTGGSRNILASSDVNLPMFGKKETLEGESLRQWYGKLMSLGNRSFYRLNEVSTMERVIMKQGDLYVVNCGSSRDCPYSDLIFFEFDDTYEQPSARGIYKGDNLDQVMAKYGEVYTRFSTTGSSYVLFKSSNIIFRLNNNDHVTGWSIYYYL